MKEQTNYDYEKYVQIAQMAKMGWWESDLKNQEYICSDFIVDLLGLEGNRISFTEFHQRSFFCGGNCETAFRCARHFTRIELGACSHADDGIR